MNYRRESWPARRSKRHQAAQPGRLREPARSASFRFTALRPWLTLAVDATLLIATILSAIPPEKSARRSTTFAARAARASARPTWMRAARIRRGQQVVHDVVPAFAGHGRIPEPYANCPATAEVVPFKVADLLSVVQSFAGFKNVRQATENAGAIGLGPLTAEQFQQVEVLLGRAQG